MEDTMTKEQFITRRTLIVGEMLDNPDEHEIYPTTVCFAKLDDLFDELAGVKELSWAQKEVRKSN